MSNPLVSICIPTYNGDKYLVECLKSCVNQFFKDFEIIICDDGSSISLPYFYITIHRQTWYEKQFNARLRPAAMYDAYRATLQNFFSSPLESFNIFAIRFLRECNGPVLSTIQTAYEASTTMDEFFRTLYKNNGVPMGCILLNKWIDSLMRIAKIAPYMNHEWYIDMVQVPIWNLKNTAGPLRPMRNLIEHNSTTLWWN